MLGMKLTLIPPGTFLMGLSEEDRKAFAGAKPPRRVWIDAPFYLGTCEVTRDQFRRFVEVTGYVTDAEKDGEGGWGYNPRTRTPEQIRVHLAGPGLRPGRRAPGRQRELERRRGFRRRG